MSRPQQGRERGGGGGGLSSLAGLPCPGSTSPDERHMRGAISFFFVVVFENSSQILTWAVGLDVYKANTRDERPPMIGPWPSRLRSGGDTCMIYCHCSLNQALASLAYPSR